MTSKFFGEFMGTLILILLGNGAVAGVLLKHSKGVGAGWLAITAAWGFAVMTGILTAIACGSADAHLNPAVTRGFAITTGDFSKLGPYILAQLLGGEMAQRTCAGHPGAPTPRWAPRSSSSAPGAPRDDARCARPCRRHAPPRWRRRPRAREQAGRRSRGGSCRCARRRE